MTDRDVYLDDMGFLIDTAALDRVLAGEALPSDLPIARFVDDLREEFPSPEVPTELEDRHMMAIVAAASGTPLAAVAAAPSLLGRLRSSLAARAAALSLGVSSALTGAAYAGVLPGAVQGAVSDVAAHLGVDLPHPDDEPSGRDLPQGDGVAEDRERRAGADDSTDAVDRGVVRSTRVGGRAADEDAQDARSSDGEAEGSVDRQRSKTEDSSGELGGSDDSDDAADSDDADDPADAEDSASDDGDDSSDDAGEGPDEADESLEGAEEGEQWEGEGSDEGDRELDEDEGSREIDLELDEDGESSDLDD